MITGLTVLCLVYSLPGLRTSIIIEAEPSIASELCRYPGSENTTKPLIGTRLCVLKLQSKAKASDVVDWYSRLLLQRTFSEDLLADFPTYQLIALKRDRQVGQQMQLDRLVLRSIPGKATVSAHIVAGDKEMTHVTLIIVSHRP